MNCNEVRENLSAYIDGELGGNDLEFVEEHLKKCNGCRNEYEQLLKLGSLVRGVERFESDEKQIMSIVSRARKRELSPEVAWFPVTIRVTLLAAIIINIALFNLFRDYRFRMPAVSPYKPIRIESVVEMEDVPIVKVSFSYPAEDTVEHFTPPSAIDPIEPPYPKELLNDGIEGTVVLNIIVDEEGEVGEIKVVSSLSPEADSFAIAAAGMLRFKPARIGTTAVEAVVVMNYRLKI